jgi:hypothetical protein
MSSTEEVHVKVVKSIESAAKAMSRARAHVEKAKASKGGRDKVVSKASEVSRSLLGPSRHVVNLLAGHGALFPPCKQVSKSLAVRISSRAKPFRYRKKREILTHRLRRR